MDGSAERRLGKQGAANGRPMPSRSRDRSPSRSRPSPSQAAMRCSTSSATLAHSGTRWRRRTHAPMWRACSARSKSPSLTRPTRCPPDTVPLAARLVAMGGEGLARFSGRSSTESRGRRRLSPSRQWTSAGPQVGQARRDPARRRPFPQRQDGRDRPRRRPELHLAREGEGGAGAQRHLGTRRAPTSELDGRKAGDDHPARAIRGQLLRPRYQSARDRPR